MKLRSAAIVATLLWLGVSLIPKPIAAVGHLTLNLSQGTVGTIVSIPNIYAYGEGNYLIYWGEADQIIGQGEATKESVAANFTVPEAPRGKHKVTLKMEEAGDYFTSEFTVMPSISLSADQGTVGSSLTVTGSGFNSNEVGIRVIWDGSPLETGVGANNKGSWQSTFKAPASTGGEHSIDAEGSTPATEIENRIFTILPRIEISPTSGWVGTVIGIVGSGFASSETNIKVIYDGLTVKTDIAADITGSWQASFSIPTSAKGSHEVSAFGAATPEQRVTKASFNVSPGMKIQLASGELGGAIYVGDSLWVNGVGFEANEAEIKVTFDGTMVISNIIADAKGSWTDRFEVPPTTRGEHTIDASGEVTKSGDIADSIIIISPKIEMNPTSGAIGDEITLRGTGFAASQLITISFGGAKLAGDTTTDTKGNFITSFKIPKGKSGEHTVTVTDPTASVFSAQLSIESTPPPTPKPLSPEAGSKFSSIGKTTVAFDWSDVDDPSGIYYVLEISPSADFFGVVIHKGELTTSEYTLTEKEALGKGTYYWRVKAIDNAENEGEWTSGQLFKVGGFAWWLIAVLAIAFIAVIAIVWRVISISRRGKWG